MASMSKTGTIVVAKRARARARACVRVAPFPEQLALHAELCTLLLPEEAEGLCVVDSDGFGEVEAEGAMVGDTCIRTAASRVKARGEGGGLNP